MPLPVGFQGVLSAVIDFGDICAGDRATDLACSWMLRRPVVAHLRHNLRRHRLVIDDDGRPSYKAAGESALTEAIERSNATS